MWPPRPMLAALDVLVPARAAMVVGRGPGFCRRQRGGAEAQGNLVAAGRGLQRRRDPARPDGADRRGYPLLIFATRGPAAAGLVELAAAMRQRGARVPPAAPADVPTRDLTLPVAPTPDLDPIVAVQAFYGLAAQLAVARGFDPDQPRHLRKVTRTQ